MPEGLKIVIKADVKEAERATGSLVELKQVAKGLKGELSGLDASMRTSKGGRVLATELGLVTKEIKAIEKQANISGQAASNSLTKGFSALRQLAFVLPGIGIAGIFNIAFQGIEKFVSGLDLVKRAFNAAALDAELFKKAAEASGDDVQRLKALVSVAQDVTLSTNQRKNAISELQKLYPDYLRNISLENINSDAARKAIDSLTQSIINKALVQEFSVRAAKEVIKQEELQEKALNRRAQVLSNTNQLLKLVGENAPKDAIQKFTGIVQESTNKLGQETKEFNEQAAVVKHLEGRLKALTATSLNFIKTPKGAGVFKEAFIPQLQFHDRGQLQTELQKIFNNITGLVIPEVHVKKTDGEKLFDELKKQVKNKPAIVPFVIEPKLRDVQLQQALEDVNRIISQTVNEGFAAIGQGLGEALAGDDIGKAFRSFLNVIGSGVQAIGKRLIELGTIALLAKKGLQSLFKNPAVEIAAGVALVAVGAALKKTLSGGISGFAEGGLVFGPTVGLVGEGSGTRRSNPEVIAPLDKLKAILGDFGGAKPQRLYAVVRGNDLLLSNERTNKANRR